MVVEPSDPGFSTGALVTTGLLSFGAGMLVNEIFDDDDDEWRGYWGLAYPRGAWMDWEDHGVYPRPGYGGGRRDVDIETGDITINRNRAEIDRTGRWTPDDRRRAEARDNIGDRRQGSARVRDLERERARNTISARSEGGARLERKDDAARPIAARSPDRKQTAFTSPDGRADRGSLTSAKRAKDRGLVSKRNAGLDQRRGGVERKATVTTSVQRKTAVSKPNRQVTPKRQSGGGRTALQKTGSGERQKAASSRGKVSRAKGRRG